ncbi:hypothetical protein E6O75_ATG09722 [Venturia nashicola]|uniref:Uncharacterized protein n=1 Tax=Venturia nashicola TaxID=86259 RepID=A0A4Z1P560_9PEZI|nr:hypothetical protein E6O75_ATG09722 [Venturia nashicola]
MVHQGFPRARGDDPNKMRKPFHETLSSGYRSRPPLLFSPGCAHSSPPKSTSGRRGHFTLTNWSDDWSHGLTTRVAPPVHGFSLSLKVHGLSLKVHGLGLKVHGFSFLQAQAQAQAQAGRLRAVTIPGCQCVVRNGAMPASCSSEKTGKSRPVNLARIGCWSPSPVQRTHPG